MYWVPYLEKLRSENQPAPRPVLHLPLPIPSYLEELPPAPISEESMEAPRVIIIDMYPPDEN